MQLRSEFQEARPSNDSVQTNLGIDYSQLSTYCVYSRHILRKHLRVITDKAFANT